MKYISASAPISILDNWDNLINRVVTLKRIVNLRLSLKLSNYTSQLLPDHPLTIMICLTKLFVALAVICGRSHLVENVCQRSITTVSGRYAPIARKLCSGQVIFEENFETFKEDLWQHDVNMGGGGVSWIKSELYLLYCLCSNTIICIKLVVITLKIWCPKFWWIIILYNS